MTTNELTTSEYVRAIPIFATCSGETLTRIAASLQPLHLHAGDIVFKEGDLSDDMYIAAKGSLRVVSDVSTEKVVFAHLGPGEFFGEMALLTGDARSAGVIATTEATLWRLSKADFERVQAGDPELTKGISRVLTERLRQGNVHRYQNEAFTLLSLTPERSELTIGRLPHNDLVINDPQVDGIHARLKNNGGRWAIYDEGSESGTYVNRQRVHVAELNDGDEILIGTNKVFLDGLQVRGYAGREGVRIDVVGLIKELQDGRKIINDVSLSIQPGEFVAIVGSSGAGKSTLLHALNGFSPATSGAVTYNGVRLYDNLALFRSVLGYVPQDDIVHGELTVERTLYYGAKLRLPKDTRPQELDQRIVDVLEAVGMSEHRHTEVRRLSGGQRKRVSVALELLSRPRALYLDEPTSGLDPALEGRLMALFRDLTDQGATVVLTTHATQNLRMCDKVIWIAPGGFLLFFGSPAEALRHFEVQDFGEVYEKLESAEERERWAERFRESPAYRVNIVERLQSTPAKAISADGAGPAREAPRTHRAGPLRQFVWLTLRYAEVLRRDTANLALLLVQAPLIGVAMLILFSPNIFAATLEDGGDAFRALMALHVITASAIFLGASSAAREITKEAAIYKRERLVNLDVVPYVMSKFFVLALLGAFQSAVLLAVFMSRIDLPGSNATAYGQIVAVLYLTELAGVSMGLLISAVSSNSDRSMALVPILLIPQLIFAGNLVPLGRMLAPAKVVSQFMISKWALQLTGALTDLQVRFTAQFPAAYAQPYADELGGAALLPWVVLAAFSIVMLSATVLIQRLKDET